MLLRLQRLGALASAAGKVLPKQRSAFGQRSRDVVRAAARQRKVLALRRMLLQGDDAADLTAAGDALSVQVFSFAESNQAMRRARSGYRASLVAQRIWKTWSSAVHWRSTTVAHHADTLLTMEPSWTPVAFPGQLHQSQVVPEVDLTLV